MKAGRELEVFKVEKLNKTLTFRIQDRSFRKPHKGFAVIATRLSVFLCFFSITISLLSKRAHSCGIWKIKDKQKKWTVVFSAGFISLDSSRKPGGDCTLWSKHWNGKRKPGLAKTCDWRVMAWRNDMNGSIVAHRDKKNLLSFDGHDLKLRGATIGRLVGENLTIWRKVWSFNINTPVGKLTLWIRYRPISYKIRVKQRSSERFQEFSIVIDREDTLFHKGKAMGWCGGMRGDMEHRKTEIKALVSFYFAWRALLQPQELPVKT